MSDPAQSAAYAKAITDKDVTKKGTATIDGVETTHYRVSVDLAEPPDGGSRSARLCRWTCGSTKRAACAVSRST